MSHKKTTKPAEPLAGTSSKRRIITPYAGPTFGPFSRAFTLVGALVLGAVFAQGSDLAKRIAGCGFGVVVLSLTLIVIVCNYTEINDQQIASFFRLGPFRLRLKSVSWDEVRRAEFRILHSQKGGDGAALILFTVGDKRVTFSASAWGALASQFESIAKMFPERKT